jgi:cytochrome c-type biogenesis protein CcmE
VTSASQTGTANRLRIYTSGVARRGNPARLVIALSVAGVLAIFLLYTSIAGGGTPSLSPSQLNGRNDQVSLVGKVAGKSTGDGHDTALRFRLRDRDGTASVPVVYRGSVPDLFRTGREVVVDGTLRNGTFVAERNSLVTKCPSKYAPAKKSTR